MAQAFRTDPHSDVRLSRREALVTLLGLVGAFLLALAAVGVYLWLSWQRVYWADRVTDARAQLEQLQIEHDALQAEVAQAFSLERLARYAKRVLGMIEPELRFWPPEP